MAQSWTDEVLSVHRPDDGVLSEDASDDLSRLDKQRVWIIDVIDGTKEFSTGRADWSVHVALVVDGVPGVAAVGLPDSTRVFRSDQVTYVDGPLAGTMVVSRNNPPEVAERVARATGMAVKPMGSAGAKMLSVLLGDADAYVHAGARTSGSRPPRWPSRSPPGCTPRGSTAARRSSTRRTPTPRTSSSAGPSSPRRSSPRRAADAGPPAPGH